MSNSKNFLGDVTERVVDAGGAAVAVRDYGGRGEPPLVLLHGAGETLEGWDEFVPLLATSFRVVAYDAPGHGRSDAPPDPTIWHFLDTVDDIVNALQLERPVLVGHSMGGVIALLHAAERRTARAVVSIDGAYLRDESDPPRPAPSEEDVRASGFGRIGGMRELARRCDALPEGPARRSFLRSSSRPPDGPFARRPSPELLIALSQDAARVESKLTSDALYDSIACPVLLVCGERGWVHGMPVTPELRHRVNALPERFPHVEVVWLDSGHMIPWERPRDLATAITSFVERN